MDAMSDTLMVATPDKYGTISHDSLHPPAAGDSRRVRVLTWNILVPIFCDPSLYPGVPSALLHTTARRAKIHQRLRDAGADVLLLQECALEELEAALAGPLSGHKHTYCGVVDEAQRQFLGVEKPQDWGVAIVWRDDALRNCEQITLSIQGAFGPLPVAVLRAFVVNWDEEAIFVCAHLDGEGCPPSCTRSEQQARAIAEQVVVEASRIGVHRIVWGGDFNQPAHSKALRHITSLPHGLPLVSSKPTLPTCYVAVVYARIDHILAKGCIALATEIPECPITHCYQGIPGYYQGAIALDYLGITKPTVDYPVCIRTLAWLTAILTIWAWLPVVLIFIGFPTIFCCSHRNRCTWALEEWGSDHLPVICSLVVQKSESSEAPRLVSGL